MEPFDILASVSDGIQKRIKISPQKTNRASSAGHPCEAFLVQSRTRWGEKLPHDVTTQTIFDGGNIIEEYAVKTLQEGGIKVIEQQRSFEWPAFELTGHLDAKILHPLTGKPIPIEIKSMSPFEWDKIDSVEDMLMSKRHYVRGYPTQLSLYMLSPGNEAELAVFYIVNKLTYQAKAIWMHQDYTFAEDILKKLERVNKHIKDGTMAPKISDPDICQRCGFLHICLPEMVGREIEMIDNGDLEDMINRCQELKPLVSEYNSLDKKWKKALEGKEKVMIGDYIITGKYIERTGYTVQDSKYWQSKILVKPGEKKA